MSDSIGLTSEEETSYVTIIDSILAASDLNTISEKRIRKGLQAAVEHDITPQKANQEPIKALIMARFDKFIAEQHAVPQTNGHTAVNGGTGKETPEPKRESSTSSSKPSLKREAQDDDEQLSDAPASPSPKKKRKALHVDDDAAFAARLQAEENSRARPTRGGVNKRPTSVKKKKTPKKKTSDKVKAEDDSDLDGTGSEAAERKVNRNGGFHKLMTLSTPLSALLDGEAQLSRPQTVKRIWAYVKENDLQDPNDKRMLMCDGPMKAVFKQDKVHMFTMNKLLGTHLYAPEE
ncbi:hypothetical protein G7Y79_00011g030270 [Physcia stellaris]|nr:hypothetical protein G7Y79_00011g030270 [Physcia stellaris]